MNLYATLADIKSAGLANITVTTYDADLMDALEEGSRQFDRDTDRFFYIYEGTFYQDGGATRVILDWDVQTISTLKCDTDGDGNQALTSTYESTYTVDMNNPTTSPDAFAYPFNVLPKSRLEANPWGQFGHFGAGIRKAIRITGTFGYGNDWPSAFNHSNSNLLTTALSSTGTSMSVLSSTDSIFEAGQTLQITTSSGATASGSEQVFISQMTNSTSYTIQRAVNGTTAVTPGTTATISVYDYPKPVIKAVLIYAMRIWKRRESAFQNQVGNPELGTVTVWKGDDPDYVKAVNKYKKVRRGWYLY